ncbi:MAG: transposase, partial [Epibacterium sp.]|nr:transposase [Epibacterium sp.]NQX75495.1 transposase [Epibacterium sp.]
EITLKTKSSKADYPKRMRRIVALVEVDGKEVEMAFITNNMEWAASSICGLYQSRWAIEVFFKQIKQTLQVCDFLGHSKQAIRWQLWSALLVYLLLRFQAWSSQWPHSFARVFTMIRGVVWDRFNLHDILAFYGTAGGKWRMRVQPQAAYLPGEDWSAYGTA